MALTLKKKLEINIRLEGLETKKVTHTRSKILAVMLWRQDTVRSLH